MEPLTGISVISQAIGLSLAPAFLLVGIGAILSVLTNRLGRIADRARVLEVDWLGAGDRGDPAMLRELAALDRRMASAHWAISLCTASALAICIVVAVIFVGELTGIHIETAVAGLFILAMGLLILGLILFMIEIYIATRSVRVRGELLIRR